MANITSASAYRQRRQEGKEWIAPSGAVVRVRELDIADHVIINQFPDYLRQSIYKVLTASSKLGAKDDNQEADDDINPFSDLSGEELMAREYEIGTTLCKLGWISPAVVDEVTDPDAEIGIDELEAVDRRAYMARVFGGYQQEAQQLAPFPDRPAGSLGVVRGVPDVPPVAERPAPPAGAGVFRADGV